MASKIESIKPLIFTLVLIMLFIVALSPDPLIKHVNALSATIVDQDIIEDTIWTKDKSPYRIVKDIEVKANLVIEPGVVVEIGGDITIKVVGSIEAMGTVEQPVIFKVLNPRAVSYISVKSGQIVFDNIMFKGLIFLTIDNSNVSIRNFQAEKIAFNTKDSTILLENGKLSSLLFYPSYTGRISPSDQPSIYRSSMIIRNIFIEKYIAGISYYLETHYYLGVDGFDFPYSTFIPFFGESRIVMENVTSMIGIAVNSFNSTILLNRVVTREILGNSLIDTNMTITNSVIAWGRGIYFYEVTSFYSPSNISMRNNAIYNTYLTSIKPIPETIGMRIEVTHYMVIFDLRNNWWGEPSGPRHIDLNPEGRGVEVQVFEPAKVLLYPWLEEPPVEIPDINITISTIPSIPIDDPDIETMVSAEPKLNNTYYLFMIERQENAYTNLTKENTIEYVFYENAYSSYERLITVIAYYKGVLLGAIKKILVVPTQEGEILEYTPHKNYINKNNITFTVTVHPYYDVLVPYLNATIYINKTKYNMNSLGNGTFILDLNIPEGIYIWKIIITYYGYLVAELAEQKLVIDTTNPIVNITWHRSNNLLIIEYNITDTLSGLDSIMIYINGTLCYTYTPTNKHTHSEHVSLNYPWPANLTMIAKDKAGNIRNITILISLSNVTEKGIETTTATSPIPVETQTITSIATITTTVRETITKTAPSIENKTITETKTIIETLVASPINYVTISLIAITISLAAIAIVLTKSRQEGSSGISHRSLS